MISSKQFWSGAAERAAKTWLQTFVAVLGVAVGADIITPEMFAAAPWATAAITATVAAFLSVATSVGNADFTAGTPPEGGIPDGT